MLTLFVCSQRRSKNILPRSHTSQGMEAVSSIAVISVYNREYVSQLFYQVKHELLAAKEMTTLAKLFMELKSACQKYLIINKLFWDSGELVELCIHQMSSYLHPQAQHEDVSDVMEYCIIILELLYHMIKESFMCHSRLEVLFNHRAHLTLSLVDLLTRSMLINSTSSSEEKCLRAELSDKVYCVVSELLKAAQQLRFYNDIGKPLGLCWLVEHIFSTEVIFNSTYYMLYICLHVGER